MILKNLIDPGRVLAYGAWTADFIFSPKFTKATSQSFLCALCVFSGSIFPRLGLDTQTNYKLLITQ